jgi:hypothetical protein
VLARYLDAVVLQQLLTAHYSRPRPLVESQRLAIGHCLK